MERTYKILYLLTLAFFSYLMLKITLQYIPIQYDVAFLRIKQNVIQQPHYQLAFFTHVYSSMFALLAGFTQFSKTIKIRQPNIHKTMGYLYFVSILLFSAPAGFVMSLYANGGLSSKIAFTILSVFWWISTFMALFQILKRKLILHQYFTYISYALTLSAITLRIWKYLIAHIWTPNPLDMYRIVAWLGWVPNLLIALIIIYLNVKKHEKNNL